MRLLKCLVLLAALSLPASTLLALPLWELEGARGSIRLLGSVHFLRESDYPLPEPIRRAYREADVLVMEMDMDDLNPIRAQAVLTRMAVDPEGRTLEQMLGRADFAAARRQARGIGIDLDMLRPFEPWYAALQISQLRLAQLGLDPGQGIESRMTLRAVEDGKPIVGLETLEAQLGTLDSLPPAAQQNFLMVTLEEAAAIDESMDDILAAWRRGDSQAMERDLLAGLREQPEVYSRILLDRNRDWTRQLVELAGRDQSYLVIVGALHLVGDDSVLAMLERRGYPSRQIID